MRSVSLCLFSAKNQMIHYENGPNLQPEEFFDCLIRSTLEEPRPIADPKRIEGMLRHADVVPNA